MRKGFDFLGPFQELRRQPVVHLTLPEGRGPGQSIQTQHERDSPDHEWKTIPPDRCPWLCHFIPLDLLRLIRSVGEYITCPARFACLRTPGNLHCWPSQLQRWLGGYLRRT